MRAIKHHAKLRESKRRAALAAEDEHKDEHEDEEAGGEPEEPAMEEGPEPEPVEEKAPIEPTEAPMEGEPPAGGHIGQEQNTRAASREAEEEPAMDTGGAASEREQEGSVQGSMQGSMQEGSVQEGSAQEGSEQEGGGGFGRNDANAAAASAVSTAAASTAAASVASVASASSAADEPMSVAAILKKKTLDIQDLLADLYDHILSDDRGKALEVCADCFTETEKLTSLANQAATETEELSVELTAVTERLTAVA